MPDPHRNASTERRWLQVAGLPVHAHVQAVRDEMDLVTHVEVLPVSSRVILYDRDGVIGALDLMPAAKDRIDAKVAEPEAPPSEPNAERGDTIVRPLDMNDPDHVAALAGPRMIYDPRLEEPPIELPDYSPDGSDPERDAGAAAAEGKGVRITRHVVLATEASIDWPMASSEVPPAVSKPSRFGAARRYLTPGAIVIIVATGGLLARMFASVF